MIYEVRVPASSANLGPGYDTLGLALCKYLRVTARHADSWLVQTRGAGHGELPGDERNLIVQTVLDICGDRGWPNRPLAMEVENEIPIGRGLGSSSTAIVAGVVLAFLCHGPDHFSKEDVFAIATELEGHPDNVGPAIFGGLRQCGGSSGCWFARERPIHQQIRVAVAIPSTSADTHLMRGLLPAQYTDEEEATTRRAIKTLLHGLAVGNPASLTASEWDVKHQPYRFDSLPCSAELYRLFQAEPAIAGAFLSGAGPAVAGWCFQHDRSRLDPLRNTIDAALEILEPDHRGTQWRKT